MRDTSVDHGTFVSSGQFTGNDRNLEGYRFVIAAEQTALPGYITEKILNAFIAGAVPIYWGTKEVFHIFNRDAFVYFDLANPEQSVNRIMHLEYNRTAYAEVRSQPIFAPGAFGALFDFFPGGALFSRIHAFLNTTDEKNSACGKIQN